jgi:nitrite reductase/ring-hydroxylating ferredoxin subunit
MAKSELLVGKAAEFGNGDRRIVGSGDAEIGVFCWDREFYAYSNFCLHQGGPACEGLVMHAVEDVVQADKTWIGQKFSETNVNFVCPWHGYEYDMRTGALMSDRSRKLKSYPVTVRDENVYVVLED